MTIILSGNISKTLKCACKLFVPLLHQHPLDEICISDRLTQSQTTLTMFLNMPLRRSFVHLKPGTIPNLSNMQLKGPKFNDNCFDFVIHYMNVNNCCLPRELSLLNRPAFLSSIRIEMMKISHYFQERASLASVGKLHTFSAR